jgi:glutaredoxin
MSNLYLRIINVKSPILIIAGLFLVFYYAISQLSNSNLSDAPIILNTANPPEIIMFSSQSCHYCAIARSFFKKHNLPYIENDIDQSIEHREMFYRLGGRGTPLVIVNKHIVYGFDEKKIRSFL